METDVADDTAAIATPTAFQRTVAKVQRSALAYGNNLAAVVPVTRCQLAVQRMTAEVDGRFFCFPLARTP